MLFIRLQCYTCDRTENRILDDLHMPDTITIGCKVCRIMVTTTRPEVICAEHFVVVPFGAIRPQIMIAMKKRS